MIGKADYQLCCCDPPCCAQNQRPVSKGNRNAVISDGFPDEDYQRYNSPSGYNYKNKKQVNSSPKLNPETLDALAALRQRACNNYQGMDLQTEPPYKTSNMFAPQRGGADVRRQADMIDYAPESEFLKRMKQQCEYLRNNEENIFATLDELGFDECFPIDQSKHRLNVAPSEFAYDYRPTSNFGYRQEEGREVRRGRKGREDREDREEREGREMSPVTKSDSYDVWKKKHRSAHSLFKKSEHISRSKKPTYYRGRRKRTNSEKSQSGERFEPTLKRPHEDSCERCWRYASPARSPVNKPEQKYDPNFRRAHSNPDFEKGDGYNQSPSRPQTPQTNMQPYANRDGMRSVTPTPSEWQKVGATSRTKLGPSQQQMMSQRASKRTVGYHSAQPQEKENWQTQRQKDTWSYQNAQPGEMRQPQGKENWQSQRQKDMWSYQNAQPGEMRQPQGKENWQTQRQKDMWRPGTPASRQGYETQNLGPTASSPRQQFSQTATRPVKAGVSRSQTKMQDSAYNAPPPKWPENKPQQMSSAMNYQNYYTSPERPPRPKSCTPGVGYRSNNVDECIKQCYEAQFNNAREPEFQTDNVPRQQSGNKAPQSSFVAPGLFCYRDQNPRPCRCLCIPPSQDQTCVPPRCPDDFDDEFGTDGGPPDPRSRTGRSPGGRSPGGRSPGGRSPGDRSPGGRSPGSCSPGGRSPGGRSPDSRSPGGRSPSGRVERPPDDGFPSDGAPVEGSGGRGRDGRSPGGRTGALASQQSSPTQRQTKTGAAKGTPKTPPNTIKPVLPHSDSTVYADLPSGPRPDDLSSLDKSPNGSEKKSKSRTPSPKQSAKGKRDGGKSSSISPGSTGQKSTGRKVSPKSSKSSKSPKSPISPKSAKSSKSSKSSKSPKSCKSPKSQKFTSEEDSARTKRKSPKSRSKSASSRSGSKSPTKSSPKQALGNFPTSQTSQGPPNELMCTYEGTGRPQTVCVDGREYTCTPAYPSNKIPHDPCKVTHVVRECCCTRRDPRCDDPGNCVLCCHCNLDKPYQNQNVEQYPAGSNLGPGPSRSPVNPRPTAQTNNWVPCTPPPRNLFPENFNRAQAAEDAELDDSYANLPYKPKSVRLWQLSDQKKKVPYASNMGPIVDPQDYCPPQRPYGNNVNPKTYFVFHMRKCKPGKGNDVEVLVEETAKSSPNGEENRAKSMTEKMKKIAECPSDSMALRFQKGVSESCKTLQNSRILYF